MMILFYRDGQGGDVPTVRIQAGTPVPAGDKGTPSKGALPSVHKKPAAIPTYAGIPNNSTSPFKTNIKKGI